MADVRGLGSIELDMMTAVAALLNLRCSSGRDLAGTGESKNYPYI
jgi:hypothetical protein